MKPLKANVEVRIRTHCPTCGLDYHIRSILEPKLFEHEGHMASVIRHAMEGIIEAIPKCGHCEKITRHIDIGAH